MVTLTVTIFAFKTGLVELRSVTRYSFLFLQIHRPAMKLGICLFLATLLCGAMGKVVVFPLTDV